MPENIWQLVKNHTPGQIKPFSQSTITKVSTEKALLWSFTTWSFLEGTKFANQYKKPLQQNLKGA